MRALIVAALDEGGQGLPAICVRKQAELAKKPVCQRSTSRVQQRSALKSLGRSAAPKTGGEDRRPAVQHTPEATVKT
jgi:hypothetical protein